MAETLLPYGVPPPAGRLPEASRIGRVRLQVADLEQSLDYYTRVLGLRSIEQGRGVATLGPQADDRVIIELREKRGVQHVPRGGAFGLFHFAVLLPERADLGRFLGHLGGLGLRFGAADHLVSEAVYLTDPDGLGIEVYADRRRSDWRIRGRELAMATEPLETDSLVEAAKGHAWVGAPPGTIIGHVHLHVGDLAAAEGFYHAALGLDKVVWSYPGALFLSAGGYHHHLGTNTWSSGPSATDDQARLLDWELQLPDAESADATAQRLERFGFGANRVSEGWVVADPWGTQLRIVAGR